MHLVQTFFQLLADCFEEGVAYSGIDLNADPNDLYYAKGRGTRISVKECQELCQQEPNCNFFTFKTSHSGAKGVCELKGSKQVTNEKTGSISGPKTCGKGN